MRGSEYNGGYTKHERGKGFNDDEDRVTYGSANNVMIVNSTAVYCM